MAFTKLLHQMATIHRHGTNTADRYGNPENTYTADEETYACRIVESGSTDNIDGRETTARAAIGFFDVEAAPSRLDRVEIENEMWVIDGQPILRHDAVGPHHYEVPLSRIEP